MTYADVNELKADEDMNNAIENFKSPYSITQPNESIVLSSESLNLVTKNCWTSGEGTVLLVFLPRPKVDIVGAFNFVDFPMKEQESNFLGLPDRSITVPGYCRLHKPWLKTTDSGNMDSGSTLTWRISPRKFTAMGSDDTQVERTVFQLVNFVNFFSKSSVEVLGSTQYSISHLVMEWNEYIVHIRSLPSTREIIKELHEEGGYAITHLGEITHKKRPMAVPEITNILKGVHLFFSFVRGAWSAPILPVGYDENGTLVWEVWNAPNGEPYLYNSSWFSEMFGDSSGINLSKIHGYLE